MYSEYDTVFILIDKIIELIEKIYKWNEKEEKEINIELGNLYTIEEVDEDESCFKDDTILEEFILV
tara:strand:+ start:2823 stop:3020 length:198 start_codon:yes stop_codon:yes gene_type:complete